jgi:ubiquinone/menaquinone biosynthesis C-methylase UbiE
MVAHPGQEPQTWKNADPIPKMKHKTPRNWKMPDAYFKGNRPRKESELYTANYGRYSPRWNGRKPGRIEMLQGGGFDREATRYDRARPTYPEALFSRLMAQCGLSAGMGALEIGPGSGQATEPLAQRGLHLCAVELGRNLAAAARKRLAPYPNVVVRTGNFETLNFPAETFDLVCAATAIHWIAPDLRFAKPHRLLKSHGHLALIHTEQVSDGDGDQFVRATQPIYREFATQSDAVDYAPPNLAELVPMAVDTALFKTMSFDVFPMRIEYTSATYVELLHTFSPTIAMATDSRKTFLDSIAEVIDRDFRGRIVRHMAMTLLIARKL